MALRIAPGVFNLDELWLARPIFLILHSCDENIIYLLQELGNLSMTYRLLDQNLY